MISFIMMLADGALWLAGSVVGFCILSAIVGLCIHALIKIFVFAIECLDFVVESFRK